jgi:hypothetical protein
VTAPPARNAGDHGDLGHFGVGGAGFTRVAAVNVDAIGALRRDCHGHGNEFFIFDWNGALGNPKMFTSGRYNVDGSGASDACTPSRITQKQTADERGFCAKTGSSGRCRLRHCQVSALAPGLGCARPVLLIFIGVYPWLN